MSDQSETIKLMELVWGAGDRNVFWARYLCEQEFLTEEGKVEFIKRLGLDLILRAYSSRRGLVFGQLSEEKQKEERMLIAEEIRNLADAIENHLEFY